MDPARFRELAVAEIDAVYRMAMHLSRRPEDAADLVQETYLKALRAWDHYEPQSDKGIRPWLFKILHNNFFSSLAKRRREPTLGDDLPPVEVRSEQDEPAPAWDLAHLDWEQVDDRLKAAIDELPEHYREVLLLWAVEGLKYREIADVQDVALGTVMSRLHRARAQLSERLADLAEEYRIAVE